MLSDKFETIYRCLKCGEICELGTLSFHKCSKTPPEEKVDKYAVALDVYRQFGRESEFELSDMFQQWCIIHKQA